MIKYYDINIYMYVLDLNLGFYDSLLRGRGVLEYCFCLIW